MSEIEPTKVEVRVPPHAVVANVLEEGYQIVINKGRNHGVRVGDQYLVYDVGPEVLDPETGENLGTIELVRGRGRTIKVEEKYSILETMETQATSGSTRDRIITQLAGNLSFVRQITPAPFIRPKRGDLARPI